MANRKKQGKRAIQRGESKISEDFEIADSLFSRLRGLMFRSKPLAILFTFDYPARHAIHSFFVFFPFDAVFLDSEKKIVDVHEAVPPFTPLVVPKAHARYLLELPSGEVKRHKLRVGEKLSFAL